jgi:hypothetical protein
MLNALRRRFHGRMQDEGAALITVILVTALVTALTLTISVVATNNLVSAKLAQQAGASVDASDAGVAQAVTYLRKYGVKPVNKCWNTNGTPSAACATDWGRQGSPATVTISGKAGQSYKVWIKPIAPYPANKPGIYRITSTGVAGGPAGRTVTVDVRVSSMPITFGIVAASMDGGGNGGVHHESIFSTGCVTGRSKISFDGIDIAYGVPAAVRTSGQITTENGNGSCSGSFIHNPGAPCNTSYPFDQDSRGAALPTTSPCYNKAASQFPTLPQFNDPADTSRYKFPTTSYMDAATLASLFTAKRPPFTNAELDRIKAVAQADGTYYTSASGFTVPPGPDAVMYFELTGANAGGSVNLNDLAVAPWNRDHDPATCPEQSLLVIIEGGNAKMNSNSKLAAAVYLVSDSPNGNVTKANGTATFTGSVYANNMDLTGTADMWMDQCFIDNPPPTLLTYQTFNYREVDR